jgi:nucleoside-diphosphate-sugar epimerase
MEILLTGATGFVGTAVLARLRTMPDVTRIRVLARGPDRAPRGADVVRGDLAETRTIVGAAEGADVVIHAAGYVGNDPRMATSVNDAGTRALAGECTRSGARLIAVSTTAVYGPGPHRLAREGEVAMHPVSAASVSRSAGEAHVLSAGGKVVRAALTYGGGDRWFIPTALAGVRALGGWVGGGNARLSTVHVSSLAAQIVLLATDSGDIPDAIFHAADPEPATFREMLTSVARRLGLDLPEVDIPVDDPRLAEVPPQLLQRAFVEHTYDGELLRRRTGWRGHRDRDLRLSRADLDWYASVTR